MVSGAVARQGQGGRPNWCGAAGHWQPVAWQVPVEPGQSPGSRVCSLHPCVVLPIHLWFFTGEGICQF